MAAELSREVDRFQAEAERCHLDWSAEREKLRELDDFLELVPRTSLLLEELTQSLFGEVLDDIERNLTHAIREILGQDRDVRMKREIQRNKLSVTFQIENDGQTESVLHGQGGSVCNILSVGLRLIALSQLDPARHRPFLVLDEQDCWLRPQLVPKLMELVGRIAGKLDLQVLVISHHPVDTFAVHADRIFTLRPSRGGSLSLTPLTPPGDESKNQAAENDSA